MTWMIMILLAVAAVFFGMALNARRLAAMLRGQRGVHSPRR
jgi:hypothetical protein